MDGIECDPSCSTKITHLTKGNKQSVPTNIKTSTRASNTTL